VWRFALLSIFMSVIQFQLKLPWRNSMQAGDTSMTLRLKNHFRMTRIITEDWKLMTLSVIYYRAARASAPLNVRCAADSGQEVCAPRLVAKGH
jgi:hypothetical protein